MTDVIASTVRLLRQRFGSGTRLKAISMDRPGRTAQRVVEDSRLDEPQFVCVRLTDVATSADLERVFVVNAMVFKCECDDAHAAEAADQLSVLMQDMIDIADVLDRRAQQVLSSRVYGVVKEFRRGGYVVSIGAEKINVQSASSSSVVAQKPWQVLCVVLRDANRAMPLVLLPTPMAIA